MLQAHSSRLQNAAPELPEPELALCCGKVGPESNILLVHVISVIMIHTKKKDGNYYLRHVLFSTAIFMKGANTSEAVQSGNIFVNQTDFSSLGWLV